MLTAPDWNANLTYTEFYKIKFANANIHNFSLSCLKINHMDLYVSSIPFKWKDKNLQELFEQFGVVSSAKIIIDKITRQNKGFGFVTMPDDQAAQAAITSLHGLEMEGRALVVNPSLPKGEFQKPQRTSPASSKKNQKEFKSEKHKKSLPPWLRKEY